VASRITPSRQRNAVSEGAALGFLACKIDRIRFEKWRVDLAFEGAWRSWTYRSRFSQVNTDLTHGLDGYIAMTRAGERSHTSTLYWTRERELTIWWRHEHWDPHNHDDLAWTASMIDGDVPLSGWVDLAQSFLNRFQRESSTPPV
jgi:hypothetical protein